jgi:hypothetical protein
MHEIVNAGPVDPNGDVEPVEQWSGKSTGVALAGWGTAPASPR